jgi:lysyl-tRNA synthetase class 2
MPIKRGRCLNLTEKEILLFSQRGRESLPLVAKAECQIGDIVEYSNGKVRVLTPMRKAKFNLKWTERVLNPERLKAIAIREKVEEGIKDFFKEKGFLNVKTPTLVKSPGMETHIKPYQLQTGEFIPTSPEFAMKKLLVGGLEKIFQICPAFRYEPLSKQHHPEFTILEWYRAYSTYEEIMRDMEELVEFLAIKITGSSTIKYNGQEISLKAPWPRLKVRDLFIEHTGIDLVECYSSEKLAPELKRLGLSGSETENWDDMYFKVWLNYIENSLPKDRAVFVYRFPPSQSALSVIDTDEDASRWARRFEPYAGGLELGNAFEELTDPVEQRKRFVEDMKLREDIYGTSFPKNPIDEDFMDALEEGMPPSGGIAVGVDRLVMLLADQTDIDKSIWLQSYVET